MDPDDINPSPAPLIEEATDVVFTPPPFDTPTTPTPLASSGGGGGGISCFPTGARVTAADGSELEMEAVQTGDVLHSGGGVVEFLDRHIQGEFEYLDIVHDAGVLRVSPDHLVFEWKGDAKHAKNFRPDDILTRVLPDGLAAPSTVHFVSRTTATGAFAPVTEKGVLVVEGVLCSSYAVVESHDYAHMAMLPLRLMSQLGAPVHDPNEAGAGGMHWYAKALYDLFLRGD